jgi:RNA polymerase sigma factor (sigma-70 family)
MLTTPVTAPAAGAGVLDDGRRRFMEGSAGRIASDARPDVLRRLGANGPHSAQRPSGEAHASSGDVFEAQVTSLFEEEFARIFRVLQRLAGDADLASDLAQEAFVRLYGRGAMPDAPAAWLISVALNLLRNRAARESRRGRILRRLHGGGAATDAAPLADEALIARESAQGVRRTLQQLPERQAQLLLLSADGFTYREIGVALGINEASVGALLLRARDAFRHCHAPSP